MQFRGEPTTGTSEAVISGFIVETTRRLDLAARVTPRPGRMLMSTGDRGIHAHRPLDTADRIGMGLQRGQQ